MKIIYLSILSLFFATSIIATDTPEKEHQLSVTGSAILQKPANKFTLRLGVVTSDSEVDEAIAANREKMKEIIKALKTLGLKETEYQTGHFTVSPKYTQEPKNPPPEWMATINGYEVHNHLTISTNKLDLVGKLIDETTKAGANTIDDLSFALIDQQEAEAEAIVQAVRQARFYAEAAAKTAGVSLRDVIDINVNPSTVSPFVRNERFAYMAKEETTPIIPGDVEVSANVSIIYAIEKNTK